MQYIEAPETYSRYTFMPTLFLAGGITNCPDWQMEVCECLEPHELVVFNPRRKEFGNTLAAEQIKWEFEHLRAAKAILFWFPQESVCPMALFEYGKWLCRDKMLFVGTHPFYPRRVDVLEQTKLEKPEIVVANTLTTLIADASLWVKNHS